MCAAQMLPSESMCIMHTSLPNLDVVCAVLSECVSFSNEVRETLFAMAIGTVLMSSQV